MSAPCRGGLRPALGSDLEKAWHLRCKHSTAGSRRAAWRFIHADAMPESLRDFAVGGRYYRADPPLKPMSGPEFEKWRRGWEREQEAAAAWAKTSGPPEDEGSSSGATLAADEEEDPAFLEAVAASKKDADDKAKAEADEVAQAIATIKEQMAREAAAAIPVIVLDD